MNVKRKKKVMRDLLLELCASSHTKEVFVHSEKESLLVS
jgi:hypothetical protein